MCIDSTFFTFHTFVISLSVDADEVSGIHYSIINFALTYDIIHIAKTNNERTHPFQIKVRKTTRITNGINISIINKKSTAQSMGGTDAWD